MKCCDNTSNSKKNNTKEPDDNQILNTITDLIINFDEKDLKKYNESQLIGNINNGIS